MVWILTKERSVLIILSHTVPTHLLLVNIWVKEDLIIMIVVADTETDALAEAALVLMTDAESTIAREAVADLGLVNPSFILFSSTQKKK